MITYDDLKRCAALAREADDLRERIMRLRSMVEGCTGMQIGSVRGNGQADPVGEAVASLDKLRVHWLKKMDEYLAVMLRVDAAIESLESDAQRSVIRARFVDGLIWDAVGERLGRSEKQCRRICKAGLAKLFPECPCMSA